jgi:hypothetical protein
MKSRMALGSRSPEKSQLKSGSSSSSEPTGPEVEAVVNRSQVDHIWYPGRLGYTLAKESAEVGSLGGSKRNLKGIGWETDGTSWLMDGGEVASGMECAVISGARLMPDRSLARVPASPVRLGLARCWEATPVVVSGARTTPGMSPAGVPASWLALVRKPTRCRLRPGHSCSVFSFSGEEGGGANPGAPLPPRGEVVVEFASAGRADDRRCCRTAGGGVPCRSCRRGT